MVWNIFKSKKNHSYPTFWTEYLSLFDTKSSDKREDLRFVIFDTETTGFSKQHDRILSIGCVTLQNNTIDVSNSFEVYLNQTVYKVETAKIHGLLKGGKLNKIDELEALKQFLKYIQNYILVGHHVAFDIGMINEALIRHGLGILKNRSIDTGSVYMKSKHLIYQDHLKRYTLDELCNELKVAKTERHTAIGDALITAIVFQKIMSRMFYKKTFKLKKMFY